MAVPQLDPNIRLRRKNGVEARSLNRDTLLVDLSSGRCYRLNRVGAEVWQLLLESPRLNDLFTKIATRYAVPAAQVETDVGGLVSDLLREQLIEIETLVAR